MTLAGKGLNTRGAEGVKCFLGSDSNCGVAGLPVITAPDDSRSLSCHKTEWGNALFTQASPRSAAL